MPNRDPDFIDLTKTPQSSFKRVDHSSLANTVIEVLDDSLVIVGDDTSTYTQSTSEIEITYEDFTSSTRGRRTTRSSITKSKKKAKPQETSTKNTVPTTSIRDRSPVGLGNCVICYEKIGKNPVASTVCGHIFCVSCLEQAFKSDKRCPTCRKALRGKNAFHRLYVAEN